MGGRRMTPVGDRKVVGQEGIPHDLVNGCSLAIREDSPPKLVGKISFASQFIERCKYELQIERFCNS